MTQWAAALIELGARVAVWHVARGAKKSRRGFERGSQVSKTTGLGLMLTGMEGTCHVTTARPVTSLAEV